MTGLVSGCRFRLAAACVAFAAGTAGFAPSLALAQQRGVPELTDAQWAEVDRLLSEMTIEEKVGQMTQITLEVMAEQTADGTRPFILDPEKARAIVVDAKVGSILNTATVVFDQQTWLGTVSALQEMATEQTRLGIPLIYGVDSVHGANYIKGATIFPHNLTLAATFEPALAERAGEITAAETRACGLPWNFAPVCDVMRVPTWSRVFETFGEDPLLAGVMAAATVRGMQGDDLSSPTAVAATAKHFVGYSDPDTGRDRTPASIGMSELLDTFVPPFDRAFDAGVRTVMVNSGEINGTPVHADPRMLRDLLREEMDFGGVVVTDWADIAKLVDWHRVAANEAEATKMAVDAGIDVAMTPYTTSFTDVLVRLVRDGEISESRIDESVRRILALKAELGLFEATIHDKADLPPIGTPEAAEASLETARRGITLLRNREDVLPLAEGTKILVTGPAADDLPALHGSWTWSWQGTDASLYPDTPTIVDAMRERFGEGNVSFAKGAGFDEHADLERAVDLAGDADVIVLCLGEMPSVEKPGDISDLGISWPQMELAQRLIATGKPVVLAMVTNRPRIITVFEESVPAIVWLGHPGPYGPEAFAEILAGDVNPSGRIPFTYPRHPNGLLTYDHKYSEQIHIDDTRGPGYNPLFPFGHGVSYTTFAYENLRVNVPSGFPESGSATVTVTVRNTGERAGADAVLFYLTDEVATITPRVRRLAGFDKVDLEPGASASVSITIDPAAFMVHGRDGDTRFEPGDFTFRVGELTQTVRIPRGGPAGASGLE